MELKEFIGISSSVIGVVIVFFCQESIKKLIGIFFDSLSKTQINILFVTILIAVFALPWGISSIIPNEIEVAGNSNSTIHNSETVINQAPKIEPEVWLEAGKTGLEIVEAIDEKNQKKNSDYEINRGQRWVFQIGDWGDDEAIAKLYKEVKLVSNICAFKKGKKYCLFKNEEYTTGELNKSLDAVKAEINNVTRVDTIDLMSFTNRKKPKLYYQLEKLGGRKDKVEINCYYIDK